MLYLVLILYAFGANVSDEYFQSVNNLVNTISNAPYIKEIVQGDLRSGQLPGWFRLGMIGLIIGFSLVLLMSFSADFLNSPRLKAMANVEMKEFAFSFIILLGLLALMHIMDIIFTEVTSSSQNPSLRGCNTTGCVYNYVRDIVRENFDIFRNMVLESVKSAAAKYKAGNVREGIKFEWPGFPSFGLQHAGGFTPYIAEEQYYTLGIHILTLSAGVSALTFGIIQILGPLFISVGVFLRPLPFFRKLGATLLAIGIGFFFILPGLLILLYSFPPSLGLTYSLNDCPDICRIEVVAYNNQGPLTYQEAYLNLSEKYGPVETNKFLEGLGNQSLDGITSCEYLNNNLRNIYGITPVVTTKAKDIGLNVNKCPKICRKIPYPVDIAICYFSSSACSELYDLSNGKCFYKTYDLSVLDNNIRLADGSTVGLRNYIANTNCTKLLPLRPYKEDYSVYCPMPCRGYYNTIVWGMFTEEEIELIKNGNTKNILDLINKGQAGEPTKDLTKFLKENESFSNAIISDIINNSIKSVWNPKILITCGALYGVANPLCYDQNNPNNNIKKIYTAIESSSIDDTTLKNQINSQYGPPRGDKAVDIRHNTKPSDEINDFPIFDNVYSQIGYNTDEATIINMFRDKFYDHVINNINSFDINSDQNFNGWKNRFGNIWKTDCFDSIQMVVDIRKGTKNDMTTDEVVKLGQCSEIFGNYLNQFTNTIKQAAEAPYWAYGVCNPFEDFGMDCKYSDKSFCPQVTVCNNTYMYKTEELPSRIWKQIRNSYFLGANTDPSVMEAYLSKVYLPIYPKSQDCSLATSVDPDLLRFPPSPDCSQCAKLNMFENTNHLFSYVGAAVFRMITLPLIAIFMTFVAIITLSEYLGGEVFLPGVGKVR